MIAEKVISSIIVCSDFPNTLREVKTRKQIPNRLDEVLRICEGLSDRGSIFAVQLKTNILQE